MKKHNSIYFCGHKISEYGLQNGYLDYRTLSQAFDAVLVNDITKLFYSTVNSEYSEVEQIHGYIDNSDEIAQRYDRIDELDNMICDQQDGVRDIDLSYDEMCDELEKLRDEIDELEREQDEQREIYQYYIISDNGAEIIKQYTNDPLYYLPVLDCYVWGVTHYGTAWDYVLTDCKIELDREV